jgi:hypothetical protein
MLCALFAFYKAEMAYVAIPFALIGGVAGAFGKRNLRVLGLLLNLLALVPAVVVVTITISRAIEAEVNRARQQEQTSQEQARAAAQKQKSEAEARAKQAEAERLRQEAYLLEQQREQAREKAEREREKARREAEQKREEARQRELQEQRRREAEAERKAEEARRQEEQERQRQRAREAAEESARKADLEKKGLPYYPRPLTQVGGRNAEEWYKLLRADPQIRPEAVKALIALKGEGIPFLLDLCYDHPIPSTPMSRCFVIRWIQAEHIHPNDLHKIITSLEKSENLHSTRLWALEVLEKRAKDLKRKAFQQIELATQDMLENPRYMPETRDEIRSRLKTIRQKSAGNPW